MNRGLVKPSTLVKMRKEFSHCCNPFQICSYVLIVISGIATTLAMNRIRIMFDNECVLYADLSVTLVNWTMSMKEVPSSSWGNVNYCTLCTYISITSVISAGFWLTFVQIGKLSTDSISLKFWIIMSIAMGFNFILVIFSCYCLVLVFGGFTAFCSNLLIQVNATSCEDLIRFWWDGYPEAQHFYDDVIIIQVGVTVSFIGWLLGFLVLLVLVITHSNFQAIGTDLKSSISSPRFLTPVNSRFSNTVLTVTSTKSKSIQPNGYQINPIKPSYEHEPLLTTSTSFLQPRVHSFSMNKRF